MMSSVLKNGKARARTFLRFSHARSLAAGAVSCYSTNMVSHAPPQGIEKSIIVIRGQRVMLDRDLAQLYGIKPIALRQQVKRNSKHFPPDFLFQLSKDEAETLVSQNVIPSRKSLGGSLPYLHKRVLQCCPVC